MLFRRALLLLFILLQCVAPLLHAHTHGGEHGGAHLPGSVGVHAGNGQLGVQDADHSHHGIGVPQSLELRRITSVYDAPEFPAASPALVQQPFSLSIPPESHPAAPVSAHRLIPPSRAPPRV